MQVKSSLKLYEFIRNKTKSQLLLLDSSEHTPFKEKYNFFGEAIERFVEKIDTDLIFNSSNYY